MVHLFLDCAAANQPIHSDIALLSDAKGTFTSLYISGRVLKQDQIQSVNYKTARSARKSYIQLPKSLTDGTQQRETDKCLTQIERKVCGISRSIVSSASVFLFVSRTQFLHRDELGRS